MANGLGSDQDQARARGELAGVEGDAGRTPAGGTGRKARLTVVAGIVIGVVFTWLFVRRIDADALRSLPARMDYRYVALATVVYLLEFVFRAIRWQILLAPLRRVPLRQVLSVTFVGFMANSLLPARAGELVKPLVGSRRFRIPFSSVLVTAITERVFDLLGLLSVLLLMTALIRFGGTPGPSPRFLLWLQRSGMALGAAGVAGLALLFVLAARDAWARGLFERITSRLPPPLAGTANKLYDGLASGLGAFQSARGPLLAGAWSVAVWVNGAVSIWVMSWAFEFHLAFAGACFVGLWLAIAVTVPQAPGFIGVWQFAVSETLVAWGAPVAQAQAFAILFWLLNFGPATAIGVVAVWREGLSVRGIWQSSKRSSGEPRDGVFVHDRAPPGAPTRTPPAPPP